MKYIRKKSARWRLVVTAMVCLVVSGLGSQTWAARLILRVKAVNPIEEAQVVSIRSNLPQGVTSNDVTSLDGLNIGYDVQNSIYYVHKDVSLGPKAVEIFDVEIDDIWIIPENELGQLAKQASSLSAKLVATEFASTGSGLRQQINEAVAQIRKVQKDNAIGPSVQPLQHITAYEANLKLQSRLRTDIGHLENLVLETGQDPGNLVGDDRRAVRLRRDIEIPKDEYGIVTMRVTAQNTSPTARSGVRIHSSLPPEVQVDDVVDPGELLVGVDAATGTAYVYLDDAELPADGTLEFTVKIRDKWNINRPRIEDLQSNASNLLSRISQKKKFPSIETQLTGLMEGLEGVLNEKGPPLLSPEYVAFYRAQSVRVDELELKINRIRAVLKPIENTKEYGFDVKAPSMRTTWLIIYIVLGFLAVVSLLFFLRWYGKSKDEQMWADLSAQSKNSEPDAGTQRKGS